MKKRTKGLLSRWRENRSLIAAAGAAGGFAATVLFALYNGVLGIWYASLWHGSICIYYILLSLLRGILLISERIAGRREQKTAEVYRRREQKTAEVYRKRIFSVTSGIMLVMNMALTTPVSLMVLDQRPIQTGMIPAITSAAYTTYKISTAAVKVKRTSGTILDRELRVLRLVDALVSVLVLQNTLIIAVDGSISPRLFQLVAISSAGILLLIFAISVVWFVRSLILYRNRH